MWQWYSYSPHGTSTSAFHMAPVRVPSMRYQYGCPPCGTSMGAFPMTLVGCFLSGTSLAALHVELVHLLSTWHQCGCFQYGIGMGISCMVLVWVLCAWHWLECFPFDTSTGASSVASAHRCFLCGTNTDAFHMVLAGVPSLWN